MISCWEGRLEPLKRLIMKPIVFNDLLLTVVDAIGATHKTNYVMEGHNHLWFEINYISHGKQYTTLNGAEFLGDSGRWFIVPPGVMHSHRHCDGLGDDGLCFRFMLEKADTKSYGTDCIAEEMIKGMKMLRPYGIEKDGDQFIRSLAGAPDAMVQLAFIEFLLELSHEGRGKAAVEALSADALDSSRLLVNQAILYMKNAHNKNFNVFDMANSLYVSYRHLSRVFKEVTGFTLTQMLNEIKVEHAKKLLMETNQTLKRIAEEVGFENEYYMSKIFTKYAHQTPSDFRKSFKAEVITKMIL